MKKAFTLLELLVVVGIMGMLGIAASGAYSALQRGMQERGAVAVAATVLRAAQERADVDRMPTCVFCYNRLLKKPTGEDENGIAVGVMTAIRRSGRLSKKTDKLLYDEFADLDKTYEHTDEMSEAEKAGGSFRLFKFNDVEPSEMEYSIVSDMSVLSKFDITLFSGAPNGGNQPKLPASAFLVIDKAKVSEWKVGDGYGFAFAEMQLPEGFVFGQDVPTEPGSIRKGKIILFKPDEDPSDAVQIYWTRPDASGYPKAVRPVGKASAKSEEAV